MIIKILHFIALTVITSFSYDVSGQDNCPEKITYEVSRLILDENSIPIEQYYFFKPDTLRVVAKNKDVTKPFSEDLVFNIIEKKCTWNKDFTEGQSDYKLLIKTDDDLIEYPSMKIVVKGKSGQIILQYPGEKERVFEMVIK